MLTFSYFMENTLFEGSLVAWIAGIPFIILILLSKRDHKIDVLLNNVNTFVNGDEIQQQIRYIQKLYNWQLTHQDGKLLFDGYLEIHKLQCIKEDCPLKEKNQIKKRLISQNQKSNKIKWNKKKQLICSLIKKLYTYGIQKFPKNTTLRIQYSFFLETQELNHQALQELINAGSYKATFDEQFVIFRYRKIFENEIAEKQQKGATLFGLDLVSENAYQNIIKQFNERIEQTATLYMDFWFELAEKTPDLEKLNFYGSKVNIEIQKVEDNWQQLLRMQKKLPKFMRLYGQFNIKILNDQDAGEELLRRAKVLLSKYTQQINLPAINDDDDQEDVTPWVVISTGGDKMGDISQINLAAASLFSYSRTELINRKINVMMPNLYSKYHDKFIENYLERNTSDIIGTKKTQKIFGLNKSNYIFPLQLSLNLLPLVSANIQIIGQFRIQKAAKYFASVLFDEDGLIDSISSQCLYILKIDEKYVSKRKPNIKDLIPDIFELKDKYQHKNGHQIMYTPPKDVDKEGYIEDKDNIERPLLVKMTALRFFSLSKEQIYGYYINVQRVKQEDNYTENMANLKLQLKNSYNPFQFYYNINLVKNQQNDQNMIQIIGTKQFESYMSTLELNPNDSEEIHFDFESSMFFEQSNTFQKRLDSPASKEILYDQSPLKMNKITPNSSPLVKSQTRGERMKNKVLDKDEFAGSIITKSRRFFIRYPFHLTLQSSKDSSENKIFKCWDDIVQDQNVPDISDLVKSKKILNQVVNDQTTPQTIYNLTLIANILLLALFLIAGFEYFITDDEFRDIKQNINLIDGSNKRISDFMIILAKLQDLQLLQKGLYNKVYYKENKIRYLIKESLLEIADIQKNLQLNDMELSEEHTELNTQQVILMYYIDGTVKNVSLNEATRQIIQRTLEVLKLDLSDISIDQQDVFFIQYNLFNNYYMNLTQANNYYVDQLVIQTKNKKKIFTMLLCFPGFALILAIFIMAPIFIKVVKQKEKVISLFLELPEDYVKQLHSKCEIFISNLQVEDQDDIQSDIEVSFNKETKNTYQVSSRKKKFKNTTQSHRNLVIKFSFASLLIFIYFFWNYIISTKMLKDLKILINEISILSKAEGYYCFVYNAERLIKQIQNLIQRQMIVNQTFPVLKNPAIDTSFYEITKMQDLDTQIHQVIIHYFKITLYNKLHSQNIGLHNHQFQENFNKIMMQNPCEIMGGKINDSMNNCKYFAEGSVYQGMAVALTRQFENLRYLQTLFVKYSSNPNEIFEINKIPYVNITGDPQKDNLLNILNLEIAIEVNIMQFVFIKESFRFLIEDFRKGIDFDYQTQITRRLTFYVFFNIFLVMIYMLIWQPKVYNLNKDIWRTKSMLTMIPMEAITKISNIRKYMKHILNESMKQSYVD